MRCESKDARLVEQIVQIHGAALERAAEVEVVFADLPTHVIGPGVVIAREKRRRVVTERKASLHTDALDAGRLWLKRNADTERGHIRCVVPWTAVGHFSRVTEPKIVHKPRRKKVSFMSQEVLRGNRKRGVTVRD